MEFILNLSVLLPFLILSSVIVYRRNEMLERKNFVSLVLGVSILLVLGYYLFSGTIRLLGYMPMIYIDLRSFLVIANGMTIIALLNDYKFERSNTIRQLSMGGLFTLLATLMGLLSELRMSYWIILVCSLYFAVEIGISFKNYINGLEPNERPSPSAIVALLLAVTFGVSSMRHVIYSWKAQHALDLEKLGPHYRELFGSNLAFVAIMIPSLFLLLIYVNDEKKASAQKYESNKISKTDLNEIIEKFEQLIFKEKAFLDSDLSLDTISLVTLSDKAHVSQAINRHYRQSFTSLVNAHRINHAKQLIADKPNETLSNIAYDSGFKTSNSFRRNFKEIVGVNPSEYQIQVKA